MKDKCAIEREEKQRVEEEDRAALQPSADSECAHGISGKANDRAQWIDGALERVRAARAAPEEQRQQQNEGQRAKDVNVGERGVRCEPCIESGQLRRGACAGRRGERDNPADDDGHRNHDAEPEANPERQRKANIESRSRSLP